MHECYDHRTKENLVENPEQSASCLTPVLPNTSDQHFVFSSTFFLCEV